MEVSGQLRAPAALYAGNNAGTYWVGGLVGTRAGLHILEKEKNLLSLQGLEPGKSSLRISHYTINKQGSKDTNIRHCIA